MKVVTIAARHDLPRVRVLARSHRHTHPDQAFAVLLVDLEPGEDLPPEHFEVIGPDALDLADDTFAEMAFMYDEADLRASLKPWTLQWALDSGASVALYLEPDVAVYGPLDEVAVAAEAAGVALMPRRLTPVPDDGLRPDEADMAAAGLHDPGLIAVADRGRPWLTAWQQNLTADATPHAPQGWDKGQHWIDQTPTMFPCRVLTDPGLNLAFWNLDERGLVLTESGYLVGGHPLRTYRFAGYLPSRSWCLSAAMPDDPRVVTSEHPALSPLLEGYGAELRAEELKAPRAPSYRYGSFADGTPVTSGIRSLYRSALHASRQPRPFTHAAQPPLPDVRAGFQRVSAWLREASPRMPRLTRLAHSIWASRVDLQGTFPDPQTYSRLAYLDWLRTFGVAEGYLSAAWTEALESDEVQPSELVMAPGCNVFGYFSSVLGVGTSGRQMVDAVTAAGLPNNIINSTQTQSPKEIHFAGSRADVRYPVNVVVINADLFPLWADQWGPEFRPDAYTIGLWAWELEDIPPKIHRSFALVDEIWSVSDFVQRAYARVTDRPVHTFPAPVAVTPARAWPDVEGLDASRGYFIFSFDYLSEMDRKNPLGLITAFLEAFPDGAGPDLVIKSINGEQRRTDREHIRQAASASPRIHLIETYVPTEDMEALVQHALAFVSLHRSEGLGLSLMEAMAQGTPAIATGYSGNLDFMDDANSILIPYTLVATTGSSGYYHGQGHWAEPDLAAAAAAMRAIAADRSLAESLGERAKRDIHEQFSLDRAADFVRGRVEEITQDLLARQEASAAPPPPPPSVGQRVAWRVARLARRSPSPGESSSGAASQVEE